MERAVCVRPLDFDGTAEYDGIAWLTGESEGIVPIIFDWALECQRHYDRLKCVVAKWKTDFVEKSIVAVRLKSCVCIPN